MRNGVLTRQAASRYYGVVTVPVSPQAPAGYDPAATGDLRAQIRATRTAWPAGEPAGIETEFVSGTIVGLGEHLVIVDSPAGFLTACDCGRVLARADENWKPRAAHARLTAEDLGPQIRLHADLEAHGYACPGCGVLLDVEVRRAGEDPLHDALLALDPATPLTAYESATPLAGHESAPATPEGATNA